LPAPALAAGLPDPKYMSLRDTIIAPRNAAINRVTIPRNYFIYYG
jgi:hypothetical protein